MSNQRWGVACMRALGLGVAVGGPYFVKRVMVDDMAVGNRKVAIRCQGIRNEIFDQRRGASPRTQLRRRQQRKDHDERIAALA
eukprot:gene27362-41249_t